MNSVAKTSTNSNNPWTGKVHVTEVYQPSFTSARVLACASIAIGKVGESPSMSISGVKVIDGKNGTWIGMPSEKRGDEWRASFDPCDELKAEIERVVLAAYAAWHSNGATADIDADIPF